MQLLVDLRQSLLEVLRDVAGLTGSKEGCNNGNCGACNIIFNGTLVNACLVLGVEAQGATVETVEGIARNSEGLHPVQQKFLEHAALQCGICTPGFIVSAKALLDKNPRSQRARSPLLAGGQPLPLHRLRQNRARRARCERLG